MADPALLEAFGERWNKKADDKVAFDPTDEALSPGPISFDSLPTLDITLGGRRGGIPRGRTTILVGAESSGKTFISQLAIASAQRAGGIAMFFDVERTFDPVWFAKTGVDVDKEKLRVFQPQNLEQTFDMVADALVTVQPAIIVVDSIASLAPKVMMEKAMEDGDQRGVHARKCTEGTRKVTQLNKTTALILINQIRINMGQTFGNPETMPGGKGLRHFSSLTVRMRQGGALYADKRPGQEDKDREQIGFIMKLRTEKNKCAPPFQRFEVAFYFDGTVDPIGPLARMAIRKGIIEASKGGFFVVPGMDKRVHGYPTLKATIKDSEDLQQLLLERIRETLL